MIGKKLGGRYEILDRVGGGGMAVVYKAKDNLLDRIIAVKILRPQYAIDDDFVHRFRREAQAAASLSHPNIVSIYDVGVEEDTHYIIMEYVEGNTLKEYINENAPLAPDEAIKIAKQIAEALEHAHFNQIIHRDIKPHNILVGQNKRVKVTDFGIARAVTSATITHTGSVIGSVHYFSPEQARGGMTGEKSDIYSLGIVLYEMLTGELPFSGESPISVALKHLQDSYTEPRALNPRIPQSVENIILRCLAKDPTQRYASAKVLIRDLDTCLHTDRLTEDKYTVDQGDDEEATKVVPVVREDMYETKVHRNQKDEEEEDEEEWEEKRKKKPFWVKFLIFIAVFVIVGFGLYQLAAKLLYVPDVVVENVTNKALEEAVAILEAQGLRVDYSRELPSDEVEEGYIISQVPVPDATVKKETFVRLTVSTGKDKEKMPPVEAMAEETALRILTRAGFSTENIQIERESHPSVQKGFVIKQEPAADEFVIIDDTKVVLVISEGKPTFGMPRLIGKSRDEAESLLQRNNLVLEKVEEDFSDAPIGTVYRQHPVEPHEQVAEGTPIRIWVSKGPKETFREKQEDFIIFLREDEQASITIFVTDVDGTDRQVVQETLDETKSYQIKVKVSREQAGVIKIFKNGELYERKEVKFD